MHLDNRRGRVIKPTSHAPHRHSRSIVLNQGPKLQSAVGTISGDESISARDKTPELVEGAVTTWVLKRDRHMQLINPSVYEKELSRREKSLRGKQQHPVDNTETASSARGTIKKPSERGSKLTNPALNGPYTSERGGLSRKNFPSHSW